MVCTSTISTIRPRTMHPVSNISICRIVIPLTRNGDPTFCPVIHQEDAVIPHGSVLRAFNTRARKEREGEQKKHRRHPIIGCEDLIVAFYARVFVSHCRHFPAPCSTKALHTRPRGKCAVPGPLLLDVGSYSTTTDPFAGRRTKSCAETVTPSGEAADFVWFT